MTRYRKPWDRKTQDRKRRAERLANRRPFIYFFRCRGFLKIGWTTDIEKRLSCVQMCNPDEVVLAALMRGGTREELALHHAFRSLYHRAEWFREEGILVDLVRLIAGAEPSAAREIAGDWFLNQFGRTDLLPVHQTVQKPAHSLSDYDENVSHDNGL